MRPLKMCRYDVWWADIPQILYGTGLLANTDCPAGGETTPLQIKIYRLLKNGSASKLKELRDFGKTLK